MNHYFNANKALYLFFCIISFNLFAQDNPSNLELKRQCKVYFSPNSSTLSKEAIQTIRNFLANEEESYSEFRLQAFTDDVGTKEANEILAQDRYQTVQFFLVEEGLENTQIKTKPFQQIPLDPTKNASEQRKENRRVVIEQWVMASGLAQEELADNEPNENALSDFFNKNRTEAIQEFNFNAAEGIVIEGEKGTMLYIPKNCFVDKNGNTYSGNVVFGLSEAYSYADLISQNLATVSNGQMLETGGSFYLSAKTETGEDLTIKNDAQITAVLPTEESESSGMQTFEGQTDNTGIVNWIPTQQIVQTSNNPWRGNNNFQNTTNSYKISNIQQELEILDKTILWKQKTPRPMEKPVFRLRQPKFPRLQISKKPNKEELKTLYPKKSNETNKNYAHRINDKYNNLNQRHLNICSNNNKKTSNFRSDSIDYVRSLAKYNKSMEKYLAYNDQMRAVQNEMYENIIPFKFQEYSISHRRLSNFFERIGDANSQIKTSFEHIIRQTREYTAEGYDMDIILEKINQTKMSVLSSNECKQLKESWSRIDNDHFRYKFFKTKKYGESRLNSQKRYLSKIQEQLPNKGIIKPSKLRQIHQQKEEVEDDYDFAWLNKTNLAARKVYQKRKKSIDNFVQLENAINDLQKAFYKRKNELGILSPNEIAQVYGNALKINSLGWINCDRFYNSKEPKIDLEIVVEQRSNTVIFVIFEDIKSLMPTYKKDDKSYVAYKIPQNQVVKVIGIRVSGTGTEFFEEIGTVAKLNKIKPTFKKRTFTNVEELMTAI